MPTEQDEKTNYQTELKKSIERLRQVIVFSSEVRGGKLTQEDVVELNRKLDNLYQAASEAFEESKRNGEEPRSPDMQCLESFAVNMNNLSVSTEAIVNEQRLESSAFAGGVVACIGCIGCLVVTGAVGALCWVCCVAITTVHLPLNDVF